MWLQSLVLAIAFACGNLFALDAPVITGQPVDIAVNSGQSAVFTVTATGNPLPTYQWQSAPAGSSTFANIGGATSATYTKPVVTPHKQGMQFRCVVKNSVATVSSAIAVLTVNYVPVITTRPIAKTANAGETATFFVIGNGMPAPSYQWQPAPAGTSVYSNIPGANSATYTTATLVPSDNKTNVRCVLSNSVGSVTSSAVALTVNYAPTITTEPVNMTITAGQTVVFTVAATGYPVPTYEWQTAPAGSSTFSRVGSKSTYTRTGSTASSNGTQFRCVVKNALGTVTSSTAILTVLYAPAITTQPVAKTANAGQTVSFSVVANANPTEISYQWQSAPADSSVFVNISGANSANYTTAPLTSSEHKSKIRCLLTNSVGVTTSKTVLLSVNYLPCITTQPANTTGKTGLSATFSVVANAYPAPRYQWESAPPGSTNFASIAGATASTYVKTGLLLASSGTQFRCSIKNSMGTVKSSIAVLTVNPSVIAPVIVKNAPMNRLFTYQIRTIKDPTSFTATGLPACMSLNTSTGIISGTPTATGAYFVTVSASNALDTATEKFLLIVNLPNWPVTPVAASLENSNGVNRATAYIYNDTRHIYLAAQPAPGWCFNGVNVYLNEIKEYVAWRVKFENGIPCRDSMGKIIFESYTANRIVSRFIGQDTAATSGSAVFFCLKSSSTDLTVGSTVNFTVMSSLVNGADTDSTSTIITYTIQPTRLAPDLPELVQFSCRAGGSTDVSFWRHTINAISDANDDYDFAPLNVELNAWCAEKEVYLNEGTYWGTPIDTLSDNLPERLSNINWNRVNYLLNNKTVNGVTANKDQIQNVIWKLRGESVDLDATATALYDAAMSPVAATYTPGPGEVLGVFIPVTLPNGQTTLIEVIIDPYWVPTDTWNG